MGQVLDRIDALPAASRWAEVRRLIFADPFPLMAELRQDRPIWALPDLTIVSRHADCMTVLRRHHAFGVDLYKPKQGGYFMAQDDTAVHWREKSVMKAILDREDIPRIREFVANTAETTLDQGNGSIDLVRAISRGVPVALVQEWFGFSGSNPDKLIEWSYWNQQDAFWNQPFDAVRPGIDQQGIIDARNRANVMMALYLGRLVFKRRVAVGLGSDAADPVTRLVKLSGSEAVKFRLRDVIFNVGGLLIGAVETTSHAVCNALVELSRDPARWGAAIDDAREDDPTRFDGHVMEALRFNPAFPYFFRVCHTDTELAGGTPHAAVIPSGRTVIALTQAAMFDPAGFPKPDRFDPARDLTDAFTFGQGLHHCLGVHIARVMVPEIVRQVLRRPGLSLGAGPDYAGGTVPARWDVAYER